MPDSPSVTLVFELVDTKAEAKQVFDKEVAVKLDDGYTYSPAVSAEQKTLSPSVLEAWYGNRGNSWFYCDYRYDTDVHSWIVFEQSAASS
jgi:hypothetical protein